MGEGQRGGRQRTDVPVPEPHVAGLLVGEILQARVPLSATANQRLARTVGWPVLGIGLLLIAWAVRTVGDSDGRHPTELAKTGPYAFTRNPMYVGWTVLYLGLALILNTAWLFIVFPGVMATCHWVVRREERALEHKFAEEYRAYRREVRRYL